jgi:hypothetical protein
LEFDFADLDDRRSVGEVTEVGGDLREHGADKLLDERNMCFSQS